MTKRGKDLPKLMRLLQAAAQGRGDFALAAFGEAEIRWAVKTGLGPLLFQASKADPEAATSPLWPLLQGADLTARMLAGEQLDAMSEIIDACAGHVGTLTLLKGISICEQHYPEPHLRPMRDIDFLVEEDGLPAVEALLFKLGYCPRSQFPAEFYRNHHHSMPFFHPQRGIWVEVHRGLFPPPIEASMDKVFSLEHLNTQLRPSAFQGRKVFRLSDEQQIVYIASHWAYQFDVVGGMIALLDMIYLLKNTEGAVQWERILHWLRGSFASTSLYLILSYLDKYRLIEIAPEIIPGLFLRQRSFGHMNFKIVCALIDRYLVDGRALGQVFSLRNLDIIWKTLLLPGPPFLNLILVPWSLSLPWRFRTRFHSY